MIMNGVENKFIDAAGKGRDTSIFRPGKARYLPFLVVFCTIDLRPRLLYSSLVALYAANDQRLQDSMLASES